MSNPYQIPSVGDNWINSWRVIQLEVRQCGYHQTLSSTQNVDDTLPNTIRESNPECPGWEPFDEQGEATLLLMGTQCLVRHVGSPMYYLVLLRCQHSAQFLPRNRKSTIDRWITTYCTIDFYPVLNYWNAPDILRFSAVAPVMA
jgi:hypothetical protein